ncbi:hypothetical protein MCW_00911 [Cardidatus Bartonella washoeensis 085-0475]|uniref:Uncharacterized protein n=1 Tax=Cardidatus Bartonella washoeensis 085-0475 TaxID=1094564 RepID=J1JL96_9HYPH|nr:hypothetical protein MCW_00911 [Bartonella washoeensis 085-0475]
MGNPDTTIIYRYLSPPQNGITEANSSFDRASIALKNLRVRHIAGYVSTDDMIPLYISTCTQTHRI